MAEINAILAREDVTGIIVLHLPGFVEYRVKLEAKYSQAKQNGSAVRFKSPPANVGNQKFVLRKLAATSNMLHMLSIKGGQIALGIGEVSTQFDKELDVTHGGGINTSQEQQDN